MNKMSGYWDKVHEAIGEAHAVAWDECHKIYVAMDEHEAKWFSENYRTVVVRGEGDYSMAEAVEEWWEASCPLKFITAVRHNPDNPNDGFVDLIPQFGWDDDDEDDWS
jgi:hypothetical protein